MKRWAPALAVLLGVVSCTAAGTPTTPPAPSSTATSSVATTMAPTVGPPVDLAARPMVWFAPHPAVDIPGFVKGSSDYFDLFAAGASWTSASRRVHAFKIYDQIGLAREPSDDELLTVIEGLNARDIPLAMELGALPPHPGFGPIGASGECGEGVEGFSGVVAVQTVQRIKDLGGSVALVAFDEPLAHGHFWAGANACDWSMERVAEEVAEFVSMLRDVEPGVVVGDIEPAWVEPEIGADDVAAWLDAYEAAAGEPLGFFHLDVDWERPGWPEVARQIEDVVRARGVPFGIIYNGGDDAASDAEWVQRAAERAYLYEQVAGGRPDHVVLQSWHFRPQRVLPDDDVGTFTGLIQRYFGERTVVETTTVGDVVEGRVVTVGGGAIPAAAVTARRRPLDGARQTFLVEGVVPDGAVTGEVAIRINTEGAGPGPADLRVYRVGYAERGEEGNRVPDPDFGYLSQFDLDGVAVAPSDSGDGTMLRLTAGPDQEINLGSERFEVTPGAPFRFVIEAAVPQGSADAGYGGVIFLADTEIDRFVVPLRPLDEPMPAITADGDGRFTLAIADLPPGRHLVTLSYAGDLNAWPSAAEVALTR